MIPAKDDLTIINGKKICWMYRKGRCRFGHNCKYAHDSDVHNENNPNNSENTDKNELTTSSIESLSSTDVIKISEDNEIKSEVNIKKKKRPGLSQTLVPGKKVLNLYKKQKLSDNSTSIKNT